MQKWYLVLLCMVCVTANSPTTPAGFTSYGYVYLTSVPYLHRVNLQVHAIKESMNLLSSSLTLRDEIAITCVEDGVDDDGLNRRKNVASLLSSNETFNLILKETNSVLENLGFDKIESEFPKLELLKTYGKVFFS